MILDKKSEKDLLEVDDRAEKDKGESEKINCEECSHFNDCPRMKGVDFCHGRQKWLQDISET